MTPKQGEASARTALGSGRARRKRDSLSREIILAAAETVALRDGLDGLTFQAIGIELDAHPTSVYRHFRDKDDLLLELIDNLRARSYGGTLVPSDSWQDDLRLAARRVREHYIRYSMFAQQMAARTTLRPTEFANVEFSLQAILRAGFEGEEAMLVQRAFGNFVRAISSLEGALHAVPESKRHTDDLAWQIEFRRLDPERYPAIAAVGGELPGLADPGVFEVALDIEIAGIEVRAARAIAMRAEQSA